MRIFSNKLQLIYTPKSKRVAINRNREVITKPSEADLASYHQQLDTVATLFPLGRVSTQIEGGMAVAIHGGGFYRTHGDVDVAVFLHEIDQIEQCLWQHSYRLFSRNGFHAFEYAPFDQFRATSAEEICSGKRVKRVMAVRVDAKGRIDRCAKVLPRFDMHVHRREGDTVYLDCGHIEFPLDLFEKTVVYETPSGQRVTIASAPLMCFYKSAGRRPRHKLDLAKLEQSVNLTAEDRERAERIFLASQGGEFLLQSQDFEPARAPVQNTPLRRAA